MMPRPGFAQHRLFWASLLTESFVLQIGLIVLSMLVTRSSVLSLQAKQGLPAGNQAVGWLVLGKSKMLGRG